MHTEESNVLWTTQDGYVKRCEHCGSQFESKRYDTKYCGAGCRKGAQRARMAKNQLRIDVVAKSDELMQMSDCIEDLQAIEKAYQRMQMFLVTRGRLNV